MRIGLTGGVASGKSTAARILRELGAVVLDADQAARAVVAPGTPGLAAVTEQFGAGVLTGDGALDRERLGALVFADTDARRRLEAIIHPLVRERLSKEEHDLPDGTLVVSDIPLLVETGQEGSFDAVVVIDVPEELQIARLVGDRGWSQAQARDRIAAQASRDRRSAAATYVVDNTGSVDDLRACLARVVEELRASQGPPETES